VSTFFENVYFFYYQFKIVLVDTLSQWEKLQICFSHSSVPDFNEESFFHQYFFSSHH